MRSLVLRTLALNQSSIEFYSFVEDEQSLCLKCQNSKIDYI